jgi:cytochrome c oxidase assembly protein subunit 15
MADNSTSDPVSTSPQYRRLLFAASIATFLLIVMGSTVCVTGSAMGCPDWPACHGRAVPPMRLDAIIEYTHRFVALLASPLIFAAAIVGRRKFPSARWATRPSLIAIPFLLAVVVFGAMAVLRGLEPGLAALDLGSALIVLGLMAGGTAAAFFLHDHPAHDGRPSFRTPFAQLTLWTAISVYLVLVSAVLVAASGSLARCLGWPLYSNVWPTVDSMSWLAVTRRVVGGATSLMILVLVVQAWRTQRRETLIPYVATAMGALFLAETLLGAFMASQGASDPLLVLYVALAAATWSLLAVLVVLSGLAAPLTAAERAAPVQRASTAL